MRLLSRPLVVTVFSRVPIILAGMNVAAGPKLAAAVTNAGGIGVIGGVGYTPEFLKRQIDELKAGLKDKNAPFGVDLLLPKVGDGARKTNYDYTKGQLPELIDIIIESGAKLFVSAVGIPPKWAVDKLHQNGIYYMNMCGHVKHVPKAIAVGADIVCCQGGEGGGHTGDVPTSVLIPKAVDAARGHKSQMTGEQVQVVAAGGIFDGRGLAMALALGASAVWVGTRFICAEEAGAPPRHQNAVLGAGYSDTVRTIIYTGRPMRVLNTPYIQDWEENKPQKIKELTGQGILPAIQDMENKKNSGEEWTFKDQLNMTPLLMGKCAGAVSEIKPAKEIMDDMVSTACSILKEKASMISKL